MSSLWQSRICRTASGGTGGLLNGGNPRTQPPSQVQQVAQLVDHPTLDSGIPATALSVCPLWADTHRRLAREHRAWSRLRRERSKESSASGLQAMLVWLGNYGHLSYEKQQELLQELGDIDIGVGTLQATNARMAEAVEDSVQSLREWVKQQPQVHVDESPWPVLGLKEWLWVSAGQDFCVFHAGDTRSRAELVEQLGEAFNGVNRAR